MNETFLLRSEPRRRRRVKDVAFRRLDFGKTQLQLLMHARKHGQTIYATDYHLRSVMFDLKSKILLRSFKEQWGFCPYCESKISSFCRLIYRPQASAAVVFCFCRLQVKIIKDGKIVGNLDHDVDDTDPKGDSVYYGKHLWHNKRELMLRDAQNHKLVRYSWTDIDQGVYSQPAFLELPSEVASTTVTDVWMDEQITILQLIDGTFVSVDGRGTKVHPSVDTNMLWKNPTRLPDGSIMASSVNHIGTDKVYLLDRDFRLQGSLNIRFRDTESIEQLQVLYWNTKGERLIMALGNLKFVSIIKILGQKLSLLQERVELVSNNFSSAIGETIILSKKRHEYLVCADKHVYFVKVILK